MANTEQIDLLMSVDLSAKDTLIEIGKLKANVADLREEQKLLDQSTAEGAIEYERLNAQIKENNKTVRSYEKQISNSIAQGNKQNGSIKSLRAELSNAKAAYAELSREERESAKGTELLDKTATLNAELKELESAYGDNQRKVGEYENATKSLRTELRELSEQLATMALNGQQSSDTYKELAQRASELYDAQADVNAQINQMASDTAAFDTMLQGAQAVTAAYGTWKAASAALGIQNEELDATMQKLVVVMGALQSLQTLQNLAQKQSNLYRAAANLLQKLRIKQTRTEVTVVTANAAAITAEATAENASTAAKVKGTIASKAAAAATWLWNAALAANPVILLVAGVLALIAGISFLVGALNKESEAAKESKRAEEDLNMTLEVGERIRDRIARKRTKDVNERLIQGRKEIQALKKNGATEAEIQKVQAKIDTDVTDIKILSSKKLVRQKEHELEKYDASIAAMKREQKSNGISSKKYDELVDKINEARKAREALIGSIDDENAAISNMQLDNIEREAEQVKKQKDAAKTRVDAAIAAYEKQLERQKTFNEATLKAEAGFQSDDFRTRQRYAQRLFALNQSTEKARLDTLRKYGRITETEYAAALAAMTAKQKEFSNTQTKELNAYFDSERKAIIGMLTRTLDEEISTVEKQYADTIKRLEAIEPPVMLPGEDPGVFAKRLAEFEEFALEQTNIVIRLEEQRDKKIEELRKSALATQIQQIENATKEAYAEDLSKYQNNERLKLETTEKMLREQIAAKKAAGLATYDEEAQLQQLALQRTALNLNRDLLLAGTSAKAKYDAKVKALAEERKLHEGNADKQLEIDQRIADAEKELIEARLEKFSEWANAATELMNGFNSLMSANSDRQLQKVQETYDKEAEALAGKYAQGLLTEAEYNRDSLKLEKQKEKDQAKIEREKAIRERASKVFSVITDTSMGIVKAVAASPITGGLPWSAIVAATGALNLATILSEPLPKAARGGLIQGPLHSQGGTVIEAEGGEAVMSRRAVSMFGPVLSALNVLGGGVPFAGPLSDGGYMLRSRETGGATADEIAAAIEGVRIVTFVEDINKGQRNYAEIESAGSV